MGIGVWANRGRDGCLYMFSLMGMGLREIVGVFEVFCFGYGDGLFFF